MKPFPTIAASVTAVGVLGLVASSFGHASAAGDYLFDVATVCIIAGPLIFFSYVLVGLGLEFAAVNRPLAPPKMAVLHQPIPALWPGDAHWVPEGLLRQRKGPLNPSTGRAI